MGMLLLWRPIFEFYCYIRGEKNPMYSYPSHLVIGLSVLVCWFNFVAITSYSTLLCHYWLGYFSTAFMDARFDLCWESLHFISFWYTLFLVRQGTCKIRIVLDSDIHSFPLPSAPTHWQTPVTHLRAQPTTCLSVPCALLVGKTHLHSRSGSITY